MHTRVSYTYSHALLAVTYPYYEFPEFPWPDALIQKHHGAVTPPAPAVQQYIEVLLAGAAAPATVLMSSNLSACLSLQMYTKQFQLESSISFSTSVTKLWQTAGILCKTCHSMAAYMHAASKVASIYFTLLSAALTLMIKPGQPAMPERSSASRRLDGKQSVLYLLDVLLWHMCSTALWQVQRLPSIATSQA